MSTQGIPTQKEKGEKVDKVDKRKMIVHIVHTLVGQLDVDQLDASIKLWSCDLQLIVHIVHMTHRPKVSGH